MRRSTKILSEIAMKYNIEVEDITGPCRFVDYVAARREAIHAMDRIGLSRGAIARAMNRDRCTISYHLRNDLRERKNEIRVRHRRELGVQLNKEIFGLVADYAKEQRIRIDTAANELLRSCLSTAA